MLANITPTEVVTFLQVTLWSISFLVSVLLTGHKHWSGAHFGLKVAVGLWNGACIAEITLALNESRKLLSLEASILATVAPLMLCVAGSLILWYCHRALREQNTKNNRRCSLLLQQKHQGKPTL